MSDWQPIESAPKDGTWILACRPSDDAFYRMEQAGYAIVPEAIHWARHSFGSAGKPCWRNDDGNKRPHHSHWMPLPSPPR